MKHYNVYARVGIGEKIAMSNYYKILDEFVAKKQKKQRISH